MKARKLFKKYFYIAAAVIFAAVFVKTFLLQAYRIPSNSMEKTLLSGDFLFVNKFIYGFDSPKYIPFTNIKLPWVNLLSFSDPKRNDVVVFEHSLPNSFRSTNSIAYIKRIIGLPGEKVSIKNGVVFINDMRLDENSENIQKPGGYMDNAQLKPDDSNDRYVDRTVNFGPQVIPYAGMKIEITPNNIAEWEDLINREFGKKAVSLEGTVINISGSPARSYTFKEDHYFMLGDNRKNSYDSRYIGSVQRKNIIGKAFLIYFSVDPHVNLSFGNFFDAFRFERFFKTVK